MIISNATPLIYLAKVRRLDLLKILFQEVLTTPEVKKEVVDKGKEMQQQDAYLIEKEIEVGWIKIKATTTNCLSNLELDAGEKSVLCLAQELNAKVVLIDERSARTAAKLLGLRPRGTISILLESVKKKIVTFDEFLALLNKLTQEGFRLSEEVYTDAIEKAQKLEKKK